MMHVNYLLEPVLLPILLDKKANKEEIGEELPENIIKNILYISDVLFDILSKNVGKTFVIDRNKELRICYDDYIIFMDEIETIQERILKEEQIEWLDNTNGKVKIIKGYFPNMDDELEVPDLYRLFMVMKYASQEDKDKATEGKSTIISLFKKLFKNPNGFFILSFDVDSVTRTIYSMEEAEIIKMQKTSILNKDGERKFLYTITMDGNVQKSLVSRIKVSIDGDIKKVITSFIENPDLYCCKDCLSGDIYTFWDLEEIEYECPRCKSRNLSTMTNDDKKNAIDCFVKGLPNIIGEDKKNEIRETILEKILPPSLIEEETEIVTSTAHRPITISDARYLLKFLSLSPAKIIAEKTSIIQPETVSTPEDQLQDVSSTDHDDTDGSGETSHGTPSIKYLKPEEILGMNQKDLAEEMLKRWIIATTNAIEVLKNGSQRESRKKAFSLSKFFFFDSISKKYLLLAVAGSIEFENQKDLYKKIDGALSVLENDGLFKVNSFHPKFLERGVSKFISLCESGEAYLYNEHSTDIENARIDFYGCKKGPAKQSPSKKAKKLQKEERMVEVKKEPIKEEVSEEQKMVGMMNEIIDNIKEDKVKDGKELLRLLLDKFDMKRSLDKHGSDLNYFK